jgi:hypothetical protein
LAPLGSLALLPLPKMAEQNLLLLLLLLLLT